jgi:hypothetical protein
LYSLFVIATGQAHRRAALLIQEDSILIQKVAQGNPYPSKNKIFIDSKDMWHKQISASAAI